MGRGHGICLLVVAMLSAVPAIAGGAQPTVPGARVRLTTYQLDLVNTVGEVLEADDQSITLRLEDGSGPVSIPLWDVASLEVSRGRGKATAFGALGGLALGATLGLAFTAGGDVDFDEDFGASSPGDASGILWGGLGGLVVGGLIGSAMTVERWDRVDWFPRLFYNSDRNDFGMSLSLVF